MMRLLHVGAGCACSCRRLTPLCHCQNWRQARTRFIVIISLTKYILLLHVLLHRYYVHHAGALVACALPLANSSPWVAFIIPRQGIILARHPKDGALFIQLKPASSSTGTLHVREPRGPVFSVYCGSCAHLGYSPWGGVLHPQGQ